MIRLFILWLDEWFTDAGRTPPTWLQRWIDRDPKLHQDRTRMSELEDQLRSQARSEWIRAEGFYRKSDNSKWQPRSPLANRTVDGRRKPSAWLDPLTTQRSVRWAIALGSIAILASGWAYWSRRPDGHLPASISPNEVVDSNPSSPSTLEASIPGSNLSPVVPESRAQWRRSTQAARDLLARSLEGTETLPSWTQRAMTDRYRKELNAFRDEFSGATRFFAVRLPMAGLKLLTSEASIPEPR
jgi:hypothetical protein